MSSTKKHGFLRFLRVSLGLVVVMGVLVYAMRDRIIARVLILAETRLKDSGLYIAHVSHDLLWNRGVVLKGFTIYTDEGRETRLASFENVGIRIPILELFSEDAKLILSSDHGLLEIETSAGDLQLNDLDFELVATRAAITATHFEASLNGLVVTVEGGASWETEGVGGDREIAIPDLAPLVQAASWLQFSGGDPTLSLRIDPATEPGGDLGFSGELKGGGFRWRGMAVDHAKLGIEMDGAQIRIPELSLDCYGGNVAGTLAINYKEGKLEVEKLESDADIFAFVDALTGQEFLKNFRSLGETKVSGKTLVFDLGDFSRTTGTLVVDSTAGVVVPIDTLELPLAGFHGEIKFEGGNLNVEAEQFTLYGGAGSGRFEMPLSGPFRYQVKVGLDGMSLEQLGSLFSFRKELIGTFKMDFDGGGGEGIRTHYGTGRVAVTDGKFYSIPLLGSLRALLVEKSPRFGMDEAHDLHATLVLKQGIIRSSDFLVESEATKVLATGHADLVRKNLDVNVRANLKGVVGVATSLVSRIFRVHGEGPFDKVSWRFAATGDVEKVAEGVTEGAVDLVDDVFKGVGEATGDFLEKERSFLRPKKKSPK